MTNRAAVAALAFAVAFGASACSWSLETSRPPAHGLSASGQAQAVPGSAQCNKLDDRQIALGVVGYSLMGVGAGLAGAEASPDVKDGPVELRAGVAAGAVVATAVGGALLWARHSTSQRWVNEGCGAPLNQPPPAADR